jgi:RHS repeat-associated protein
MDGKKQVETGGNAPTSGKSGLISPPSISLPKGGGAIRGIGEKFAANPVTGTGSLSVPIATSPGRSGFGPQLSLSYDSGSGNGPFGFGWRLSLPSITRKTDKRLPKYQDEDESDTFILSGSEDLVPVLLKKNSKWEREKLPERILDGIEYKIQRYRPRIEGLFARIERWTNIQSNETHWRCISRDNITTWYGKTANSRIADPDDKTRIFSWLICQSYDDKGNAIIYEYAEENSQQIFEDQHGQSISLVHERNRDDKSRSANRYLKRIKYGNLKSNRDLTTWQAIDPTKLNKWMFEVVFDYGEGHYSEQKAPDTSHHDYAIAQTKPPAGSFWPVRQDPFSSYRAGFEVRTYRLCHRVLMFHHFPDELGIDDYLVRSTEFIYEQSPIASFIKSVTQSGYRYIENEKKYLKKSLPPLEFKYSKADIQQDVQEIDAESLENLPNGLDGSRYQWVDLDGEGLSGILTEQADSWFYKRNLSALPVIGEDGKPQIIARFAPTERPAEIPSFTNLSEGRQQLLDLAGDGQLDVVEFDSPTPGFFERTKNQAWHTFRPFVSLPNIPWDDPNLKFVDLNGDGHADIFITEEDAFAWYQSLAETGFAAGERVHQVLDEEKGPKLVFSDGTQSVYLADISGDGLTDLIRIRNGEVCYWPNLGNCRFGRKVTMDNSPHFDAPDHFDQSRIRLADIDGSGVTDIIYLKGDGVYIYLNESGNRWADAEKLKSFPQIDKLSSVMAVDLLGNGTTCLVWSSPLPVTNGKPMRYIDLMGGQKPHLLVRTVNNLGAETHVHYVSSIKFYLADREKGEPWITRIPFPVHVVERVEIYDRVSRNRFVTRYAYHHGYFDGIEREFRGFGMVEQWDTEEFAVLDAQGMLKDADNLDKAFHVPPVLTKTWFHTGAYLGRDHISNFFAGLLDANDIGEYYREPGLTDAQARQLLIDDTVLPDGLTVEEEREACRALKGSMLRQEVYALDGTDKEPHPYTVTEQNLTIQLIQPEGENLYAVFFTHRRESINYHYERNPTDPRIGHAMTLEVDDFGNVLKEVAIGYGRRPGLSPLQGKDKEKQDQTLITYTENVVTKAIDLPLDDPDYDPDNYRTPLPCETRTYELTGFKPENNAARFNFDRWTRNCFELVASATEIPYEQTADKVSKQKRLIEHLRTLYRKDDLTAFLPLGQVETLALPDETYKLSFTPGLLAQVYQRNGQYLLSDPVSVLGGQGPDQGGYVDLDDNNHWWIPSGRVFYSPNTDDIAVQELAHAHQHFFLPHRYADPFGQMTTVTFDVYDLLMLKTQDPLDNRVTSDNDYRVLQPKLAIDPNRNRSAVAFDAIGMVVGTAVMGKSDESLGDSLDDFEADLTDTVIADHLQNPFAAPHNILQHATTRLVYDLFAFQRSQADPAPQPAAVYTLARETHYSDLEEGQQTKVQHGFSYSDGFGREIQKKIKAEPGPLDLDDPDSPHTDPRWVGSGWTIFNNKGKPVRQYESFFDDIHKFRFGKKMGVSPVLFYDPIERMTATLHPNHTYEKVLFDPWRQETWDVNDTINPLVKFDPEHPVYPDHAFNPIDDPDVGHFFTRLPAEEYLPTWYDLRIDSIKAAEKWPDENIRKAKKNAAQQASKHVSTPTIAYLDTLGRAFLTIADNGLDVNGGEQKYEIRIELDIEGNARSVIDARGNMVMEYAYNILGPEDEGDDEDEDEDEEKPDSHLISQKSMDSGGRWMLYNVAGNPIRTWDSRNHELTYSYDELQRPILSHVSGGGGDIPLDNVFDKIIYGDWKGMTPAERMQSQSNNLIGQLKEQYDTAGKIAFEDYDFKGNLKKNTRQLSKDFKHVVDWNIAHLDTLLEVESFTSELEYDALNRVTLSKTPDHSHSITKPGYNEANLLERVDVTQNGITKPYIKNIDYDTKGRRTEITYGNDVVTTYEYDKETFRLTHLQTKKANNHLLQDLTYTFDPTGNITEIRDNAQQTIYFNNQVISPGTKYVYDALYRLIQAQGREHIGQLDRCQPGHRPDLKPHYDFNDCTRKNLPHPNDGQAMRSYSQLYEYDSMGNILVMIHQANNGNWTRRYQYAPDNNQLMSTSLPGDPNDPSIPAYSANYVYSGKYGYDAHGNMTEMPHLHEMHWNFEDQLQATSKQVVNSGLIPETIYYVYGADGQRVRKITERQNGSCKNERIYLEDFEIYREYHADGSKKLERETLHIIDGEQRIALVETKTHDRNPINTFVPLTRYQFGNHLGSSSLELDEGGSVISYEEYHPYGTTAYHATHSGLEVSLKRYRYSGKERDEESGLYYHKARYYAPWLGKWLSCDPMQEEYADYTPYNYSLNNPVVFSDPDGNNVRISINTRRCIITYSTTIHLYAPKRRDRRRLRRIASRVMAFFKKPTIANKNEMHAVLRRSRRDRQIIREVRRRKATYTDPQGKVWSVRFNVSVRVHNSGNPPVRFRGGQLEVDQNRMRRERVRAGDNVMALLPPNPNDPETGEEVCPLTINGIPRDNSTGILYNRTDTSEVTKSLAHGIGHFIGFEDRYYQQGLIQNHPGFLFDLMSSSGDAALSMHPVHVEESARFALELFRARRQQSMNNFVFKGGDIDTTSGGIMHGQARYGAQQSAHRTRRIRQVLAPNALTIPTGNVRIPR